MAGFPEEGTYRIKLVGSDKYAGMSMPGGTGILRIPSEGWAPYNKWVLKYREDRGVGSERLCTLTGMSRSHYLGVLDVENKAPIYCLQDPQVWALKRTDEGIAICQVVDNTTYAWNVSTKEHTSKVSSPLFSPAHRVKIADSSMSQDGSNLWQSWEFVSDSE